MKHTDLQLNPANHFTKDLFKFRETLNSGNAVHSGKTYIAGEKASHQSSGTKNDSLIMHDFFGALNY